MKKVLFLAVVIALVVGTVLGTISVTNAATPIDIGDAATARSTYAPSAGYTRIDFGNPANADGIINQVQVYFHTAATGVKVGTFSSSAAGKFTVRAYASIGNVPAGSTQTFTVNISVKTGDHIGIYFTTGQISRDSTGGSGTYYVSGDKFGGGVNTYTLAATEVYSLYGTGITPNIPVPTISSFTPTSGGTGQSVAITGTGFYGGGSSSAVSAVDFGGTPAASYNVTSDTQMTAVVAGGATGKVHATTPGGTATSAGTFTYTTPPPTTPSANPLQIALLRWYQANQSNITFTVGQDPFGICSDGANIWVTKWSSGTVSKLRASDGASLGTYAVGSDPYGVCFDGANIWVTNIEDNTVSKLRASNGASLGTYKVGAFPEGVCFDGANIWVANGNDGTLTKL